MSEYDDNYVGVYYEFFNINQAYLVLFSKKVNSYLSKNTSI